MATFAFWNLRQQKLAQAVASLCRENAVDVLVLAESSLSETELLLTLNASSPSRTYVSPFNASPKLQFFTAYPSDRITAIADFGGLSARLIRPPIGVEVLLIGVHLPSKMFAKDAEQTIYATRVAEFIRRAEKVAATTNSLLLGDFNMDPFEDGMVGADGIHGVMDQALARKIGRQVNGEDRNFFYNPMWSRLGDDSAGPPGTFYYPGGQLSRFWHTFDQALLRPALLDYYSASGLKVITKVGSLDLLKSGRIDRRVSDHLPLTIELQLEQGAP